MRRNHPHSKKGSALILVLWCLLVLGMAVFGVVEMVELSVEHTAYRSLVMEARAMAISGLSLGMSPQLLRDDPLLSQKPADQHAFKVTIQGEASRLNLNYVLLSNHRDILVNLFTHWGLKVVDADHVADCLYDWVTPGDLRSLNGAKADDYAKAGLKQRPTYQAFVSFDEVNEVIGIDLLNKIHPKWQDSFTLWSTGPLNVNEAPPELIAAVFGIDTKQVTFMTDARNGRDGLVGTADDVPIKDTKTLQGSLALGDLTFKEYGSQISLNDTIRRVESVGQANGTQVIISVVAKLSVTPPQYLLWSEQ